MFTEEENKILNASYEVFVGRTHVFDLFSDKKWNNTGIENWVQTELIVAFTDRGYDVTTKGKLKRDCDLIVKKYQVDLGIEIKCMTNPRNYRTTLIKEGLEYHKNADLFIFLAQVDASVQEELTKYFENGYTEKHRMLNEYWMVMLVKKLTR